jgi:predicted glycoside hydrolase/deacetylase ChbG (UPF0249 family)
VTRDRRLVVNADDLGLSAGVNAGILRAHEHGIVTSASLMVRGQAAEEAAAAVARLPGLSVGLHFDVAEWVCDDGEWRAVYEVVDAGDESAVAAELERQLERFRRLLGRDPSHMDSHQHVHREAPVRPIMGRRAKELRVPLRHHGRVRYCGAFYGRGHDRRPLPEAISVDSLIGLVDGLDDGATELCCHPAAWVSGDLDYGHERLRELESLCDPRVRAAVDRAGVRLCTFRDALAVVPVPRGQAA